jgi:hypothetical protein
MYESLTFSSKKRNPSPVRKKRGAVLFPAFTQLDYYIRIPERSFLQGEWEYVLPKQKEPQDALVFEILVTENGGQEESWFRDGSEPASSKKKSFDIDLEKYSDKVVRLSFLCEGPAEAVKTVHSSIMLDRAVIGKKTIKKEGKPGPSRAMLEYEDLNETTKNHLKALGYIK